MRTTATTSARGSDTPGLEGAAIGGSAQYLTFMLGSEAFAVDIMMVKEIIEYGRVTPLPMMPAWVPGVINLRGAAVTIMDLSVRLGGPHATVTRRSCIVVVELDRDGERRDVGMVVDAVSAVLEIPFGAIEPPPELGRQRRGELIRGMAKADGRFVLILDPARAFAEEGTTTSATSASREDMT